ncbi:hypothetical protein [Paracoccus sp. DMF]|uniref:hypothetical protein n=1 Tax=Paracoccus sp. DMF TaxID=400837 RepID=UPI0021E3AFFC|nr:hypothetical protein [Paracoccus sp. DMF]MCV2446198.1 hypothetical protein [Paracoccus sp. DMF]
MIAHLVRKRLNPLGGFGIHMAAAAEGMGHGRNRYPRGLRQIRDGGFVHSLLIHLIPAATLPASAAIATKRFARIGFRAIRTLAKRFA